MTRTTRTWRDASAAVNLAHEIDDAIDINLELLEFPPGATYRLGDTFITFVCGFNTPPSDWDIQGKSERRNAGSVVIRIQYLGKRILFTGDAVGRHK